MTAPLVLPGLEQAGAGSVRRRPLDVLAMAHDASHFLLVPQAVVTPGSVGEVANLLSAARLAGTPVTFRSGGTSLSGQAVTDGILADTRRHFRAVEVLDGGRRVRVQPGVTVRQVNARLAPYGYRIGPDPSSESACTLGGVIANNSSGMSCGTEFNSYSTIESAVLVMPSGTVVDTGAADVDQLLREREPALHQGLSRLRDRIRSNADSVATVRRQFAMKNTMGYGLNAFTDHDSPADILTHLIVGSEGTLAFVASAVLRTVPALPQAAAGLLVFDDLAAATAALPELVASGPAAIELMDATSLRVGQRDPDAPAVLRDLRVRDHTALLVEYQAASADELAEHTVSAATLLGRLPLSSPAELTDDARVRAAFWHIRKGLYATVAAARPSGSSALLEDIVVPVPELLPACVDLASLFEKHRYADSVVFGHAKDGNLHFMITEQFGDTASEQRLSDFTEDLVELVLGHGGSLKAEHGTGRMMASYVRRQYGDELYAVMCEVKSLFDPDGLLNPGVIITDDPSAHVHHLKTTPSVEAEVDRCVECGYCEPVCPSKDLTTTPRQRIVLRREAARARAAGNTDLADELERDYAYDGVQTCAVDGMCQTACPVWINTGDLVRTLRQDAAPATEQQAWQQAAQHWKSGSGVASLALTAAKKVPAVAEAATRLARTVLPTDLVPAWTRDLPAGGPPRPSPARAVAPEAVAVYFVACVGRMFGPAEGGDGVARALARLVSRAGVTIALPTGLPDLCCGTPWKSKGLVNGHHAMTDRVVPALWQATDGGRLPVICDASSCSEGLVEMLHKSTDPRAQQLRIVDAVQFAADELLPRLTVRRRKESLALHPTCSSTRSGLNPALHQVSAAVATTVDVPKAWGCCAFAGDRGLLHPELTASATAAEVAELATRDHDAHASCNRTCELGMTRATGHPYQHVLELLDWATRP
jgi:D-lactate dehydrogenase